MGDEMEEVFAVPTDGSTAPVQLTFGVGPFLDPRCVARWNALMLAQSVNASEHDHLMLLDRRSATGCGC